MTVEADLIAIRRLVDDYARMADRIDNDGLAGLFAPDGELCIFDRGTPDPVRVRIGRDEISAAITGLSRYEVTQHLVANHYVELDGDVASGETFCRASHVRPVEGGPVGALENYVMNIRYLDRFVRLDEGWRIARRELWLEWAEVVPVV